MNNQDKLNGEYLTIKESIQGFALLIFAIVPFIIILILIGE